MQFKYYPLNADIGGKDWYKCKKYMFQTWMHIWIWLYGPIMIYSNECPLITNGLQKRNSSVLNTQTKAEETSMRQRQKQKNQM